MLSRKVSVLVVDDDTRVSRMVRHILELEGYRTVTAGDGEAALQILGEHSPGLVLLDIMMPGMDGYTVCRRVLPPENDTRYNLVKGGINGQERIHTRTNHQQAQGSRNSTKSGSNYRRNQQENRGK